MSTPKLIDAGQIKPSEKRYRVTWPHDHQSLKIGDVVILVALPFNAPMLLREPDMTLHNAFDGNRQYVHIEEVEN